MIIIEAALWRRPAVAVDIIQQYGTQRKESAMPATTAEMTVKLTQEQIEFFHAEGYLKLDAITTPEEVARLREIYDRLFAEHGKRGASTDYDLAAPKEP